MQTICIGNGVMVVKVYSSSMGEIGGTSGGGIWAVIVANVSEST